MIATRPESRRLLGGMAAALLLVSLGCARPAPPAPENLLLPLALPLRWLPEPSDRAAARLARAALANDAEAAEHARAELARADDLHKSAQLGEDLDDLADDLVNSMRSDPKQYRKASRKLVRGFGDDPALQARLEQSIEDDPLALARRRRRDSLERLWARTFNAVAEPIGSSLITGFVLAPYALANSGVHYLASFSNDEPLSLQDRQALVLRKEYVAQNPDAPDAEKVLRKIERAETKLAKTMRKRRLREAREALRVGDARMALVASDRALRWQPSAEAEKIRAEATERIELERHLRQLSLGASPEPPRDLYDPWSKSLMIELMATSSQAAPLSERTLATLLERRAGSESEDRADEALFVLSIAQNEAGFEQQSRQSLAALASRRGSPMARSARKLIGDPWQDPHTAFQQLERRKTAEFVRWRLLGEFARGSRYPNLPRPLRALLDLPSMAQMIVTSPLRLILGRQTKPPDFQRPSAVLAYRYLGLHPQGEHSHQVLEWLLDYEEERGNSVAALRLADFLPDFDAERRTKLAEAASEQTVSAADRMLRPDKRTAFLTQAVQEYPDTSSGLQAGQRVRLELEKGSAQNIRMTRSFLLENPRIAGERGLGLNPTLLNGDVVDGELHPNGVAFLGGRSLQIDLVSESGDEDDPPKDVYRTISTERLSRLAALLDETTRKNQLIDSDDVLEPDADRDQFIERARLGLEERPDRRPTAQSSYVYKGMRERYGMVRGRESILPFDLVLQGDFQGLSLGAFPRWRQPKETSDAFLYR